MYPGLIQINEYFFEIISYYKNKNIDIHLFVDNLSIINDHDKLVCDEIYYYDNGDGNTRHSTYVLNFPPNNICIVCDIHKLNVYHECRPEINEKFRRRLDDFYEFVMSKRQISYEKTINHLFLPRNTDENS